MKKITCVFLCLLLGRGLYAIGESSALILNSACGARPAALAGAFVAKGSGIGFIACNPSSSAGIKGTEIVFSYYAGIAGLSNTYFAAGMPLGEDGSFGAAGIAYLHSGMPVIDNALDGEAAVSVFNSVITANYSYRIIKNISAGVSLNCLFSVMGDYSAWGMGLNLGVLYDVTDSFSAGAALKNAGPDVKYDMEESPLPLKAVIGCNYAVLKGDIHDLSVSLDADYLITDSDMSVAIGIEYVFSGIAVARLGYRIENESVSSVSAGAGVNFNLNGTDIVFDYSISPQVWGEADVTLSHIISLGFSI